MARCKSCGTEIPDGAEYCEECLSKLNTAKDSESYLDSLLSAVMTEEPERREIVYSKKEASSLVSMPETKETEVPVKEETSEEEVWDEFLQDFMGAPEEVPEQTPEATEEEVPEESPMEDVFGTFFDATTELPDLKNYSIFEDVDESTVDRMLAEELNDMPAWEADSLSEETEPEEEMPMFFGEEQEDPNEDVEEEVPVSEEDDIANLFGMIEDERGADAPKEPEMKEPEIISAAEFDESADMFSGIVETPEEEPVTEFGDFADLFGGEEAEPVAEEVPATEFGDFADLFGGTEEEAAAEEVPATEFGDFSDLFGASEENVATAQETVAESDDMADLFGGIFEFGAEPEVLDEEIGAALDGGQPEAVPTSKAVSTNTKKVEKAEKAEKVEKTPGRFATLYHKLFDNVKVDPSKIKPQPTKEELEAAKQKKEEEKARSKEEKEALQAEKKEQQRQEKLEKQRVKNEKKAQKKAKKMEEAKLLLEEMESTRINRAGATIVFVFFAMIAMAVIVGTGMVSYSISIQNAEREFNRKEYTLAYNEIYGLEIKDEDILLYDRIMTVMYVQKQLNSYENYYGMNDKPRALDSLLKGLQRYEKYIDLAVDLDVDTDLDSVRKKILEKVSASFMLTEQEAMEIIQSESQVEYSTKVYDAIENLE